MQELIFKKIHEDARGKIYEIQFGNKIFIITTYVKGAPRGGHYHESDMFHMVLSGRFVCREMNLETKEEKRYEAKTGDVLNTKAKVVHLFEALEDGVFLEIKEKEIKTINYLPWRQVVEDFLKNR